MINQLNFNSRLRKETNHTRVLQTNMGCHFNSRLLTETNTIIIMLNRVQNKFQFTSPYGDEQLTCLVSMWHVHFNSRLLSETNKKKLRLAMNLFYFNSRLLSETNFYRVWLVQKRCNFKSRFLAETNGFLLSGVLCQRISTHVSFRRRT